MKLLSEGLFLLRTSTIHSDDAKSFPEKPDLFFILNLFTDFLTSPSFYKMLIFSMLELFFELNIAKIKLIKITFLINIITKDILKGSVDVKPLKPFAADSDTLKDFSFCQLPTANYKRDDCNTWRLLDRVTLSARKWLRKNRLIVIKIWLKIFIKGKKIETLID